VDYPLINGVRHEWSSVELKLRTDVYIGVREIKYTDTLKGTKLRGTHPKPIGRTRGEYDAEGSMVMYLAEANQYRKALGPGYKEVVWDAVVSYVEDGFETIVDTLVGCRITKDEGGGTQGPEPLASPWDIDPMDILWNGISSLKKSLEELAAAGSE
jgi:hypothetical protein